MIQPTAPTTVRQYQQTTPINSAKNDHFTKEGIRISTCLYIDLTQSQRKELLNGIRSAASSYPITYEPPSASGIRVEERSNSQSEIESFIGMNFDTLRPVLFQRGGLPIDLVFKLQAVSGLRFVTDKDVAAAFKAKTAQVKAYIADHTFTE